MEKFVFISYKSEDRDLVKPYRDLFDELGIKYWWDDQIDAHWGKEIGQKLNECAVVVAFLSERAFTSEPVFVECKTAREANKLIPVKLDQAQGEYHFKTVIATLNHIDLAGGSPEAKLAQKNRLLRKVANYLGKDLPADRLTDTVVPDVLHADSYFTRERLPHLAYVVALCFFEGRPHDMIQACAARLERIFEQHGLKKLLHLNESLTVKRAKLELLGAESIEYRSEIRQQSVAFIRYKQQLLGNELLWHLWSELDQFKAPIVQWLDELLEHEPACQGDIAATLSQLGRKNFYSVFAMFLDRWLVGSVRQFRCADIALSLMADDPDVRNYIEDKLFGMSEPSASTEAGAAAGSDTTPAAAVTAAPANTAPDTSDADDDASGAAQVNPIAVKLVTGFTGMAMPALSTHVFGRLEASMLDQPDNASALLRHYVPLIRQGIGFLLAHSRRDPYARTMLRTYAAGFETWTRASASERSALLPLLVFSILLEDLTVGRARGASISLWRLLSESGQFEARVIDAFAVMIASALESKHAFMRNRYKDVFKVWSDNLAPPRAKEDMLPALARDIANDRAAFAELFKAVLARATTDNDRQRITHLVQSVRMP